CSTRTHTRCPRRPGWHPTSRRCPSGCRACSESPSSTSASKRKAPRGSGSSAAGRASPPWPSSAWTRANERTLRSEMKIYNTMTRTKEELVPLVPGEIHMYSCGVTVYDYSHVGHAKMLIVFDMIARYLRFAGYTVTFVRNFTDIDDKIIRRANQEGVPACEISERYIAAFREDVTALGAILPDVEPKATDHVLEMVGLIERLAASGHASTLRADVYCDGRSYPPYGKLSGKNLDDLLAGARVDVDERKRDPRDFALWKSAKPGEPSWPSPWGPGRPGWHIECSAMAMRYLGNSLDI